MKRKKQPRQHDLLEERWLRLALPVTPGDQAVFLSINWQGGDGSHVSYLSGYSPACPFYYSQHLQKESHAQFNPAYIR